MSMFPHTITLYNTYQGRSPDDVTSDITTHYVTVLRGVLVDASKASNVRASGLDGADAVDLYIPYDAQAVDADGNAKTYMEPVAFWNKVQSGDDVSGYWTLSTSKNTWFCKDVVLPPDGVDAKNVYTAINTKHESWFVTKVDNKDFGGLKHFEVGAN